MPEVMQSWKGSQKYSKNIQNYLLGFWLDSVTHAIVYSETRSKTNHTECRLKGKNVRKLRVVTERIKCIFFRIFGHHELKSKLVNDVPKQLNITISTCYYISS